MDLGIAGRKAIVCASSRGLGRACALALAEAGQGVAIIPSVLQTDRYRLRIAKIIHRRRPLRDRYVIQWDKRRPMPSYAQSFCKALAAYMRELLPITRPSLSAASRSKRHARPDK